ncbi:ribose 5-phosphate isomerase B [Bellilinea caldifistulae]|uniref:Ribose 5-phosphate isomerase n=1 Tax=Bellilinea caldifistulae TaxID=360411 RepID=A0A0P6XXA4_9CHLR|nr:ribose 5-phosphate isomerase B [Bellilinea caldifistulae]KPL73895.1 ribose 5-phosphate isomerase [Bellilinea caldifistulae]GAP11184.1 ribose 5-phosphate isomerase B [Bellilinea caldifistulae]
MRVAISCDHAGFLLKDEIIAAVRAAGHEVLDLGTNSTEAVDYPDFTRKACQAVIGGEAQRAIVICGSGVGASIAANKFKGIYAGLCHDTYSAHQGVEHDNMNVLCLGSRIIGAELAKEIVRAFLSASFSGEERHARRFGKIQTIEKEN